MANRTAWHSLSLNEVYKKLNASEAGLTTKQAEERFNKEGANELPEPELDGWWLIFFRQFQSPLIYVLLGAMAIVLLLGKYTDGFVILSVLVFNAVVGSIQEGKAQNTLQALRKFVETYVSVLRDSKEILVLDSRLVPGDIILLNEGDKVPADARLIGANVLRVDEAALTGESAPVHKTVGRFKNKKMPATEQRNMVFKGTSVIGGRGEAIVVETGLRTEIGRISRIIAGIRTEIPFRANIRNLSRLIVVVVSIVNVALLIIGLWRGEELQRIFLTAVSLAVSVIPEGLPVVTTLILAFGVMRMAKKKALVKRLQAVEALGQARVIAVDKTGTITRNEMVIRKLFVNDKLFDVSGEGYKIKGAVGGDGPEVLLAGKIAAFCANAWVMEGKVSGDPTEAAMWVLAKKIGLDKKKLEKLYPPIGEIPFNYKNKYHATFHKVGKQRFTAVSGAPETIFNLCKKIWLEGKLKDFSKRQREKAAGIFQSLSSQGLRVIAFAFAEDHITHGVAVKKLPPLVFTGFFAMEDAIRKEVKAAVQKVKQAGMRTVMITGDHKTTAVAIARQVGIYKEKRDKIMTDAELSDLNNRELDKVIDKVTVFARIAPEHKMRIIDAYRRRGEVVAMTGDGVNDAPSLVSADLGVAMGKIGTEVAKEASDIVLLDDNFGTITAAVEEGRHIYQIIKKAILYLFSTSFGEILSIFGSLILGWPLLLLPAQIIWLNAVTDGFLAVSFAWEPKSEHLLRGTFERPKKYLIDKSMVKRSIFMSGAMMVSSLLVFGAYFQSDLPKALTMALTTLAIMQWFNAWNIRSEKKSLFQTNLTSNKFMFWATAGAVGFQLLAIYWRPLQIVLKTVPLNLSDWTLAFGAALSIVLVEEIRKYFNSE